MNHRVGDKVMLKSGGPDMRIVKLLAGNKVRCTWRAATGERSYDFPAVCVVAR